MDLLDRYLQAVRFFLPRGNEDDIVRELGEDLRAQMDDREEALGRPLTDDERSEILRRYGHPMLIAGRYRTHQQLIGPVFFPMFLVTLKLGLAVSLLVTVVLIAVTAATEGDVVRHIVEGLLAYPGRALMVFAWTAVGFAMLDYAQARLKLTATWDPKTLPRVQPRGRWISRFNALAELIFTSVALIWLLLVPRSPVLVLGPLAFVLSLAPIWGVVYIPLVAITVATAAVSFVNFLRPYWTPARSIARIAIHVVSFAIFAVLLHAGQWVTARPDAVVPAGQSLDRLVEVANVSCQIGLAFASVVALFQIVREVLRWRSRRGTASQSGAAVPGQP